MLQEDDEDEEDESPTRQLKAAKKTGKAAPVSVMASHRSSFVV